MSKVDGGRRAFLRGSLLTRTGRATEAMRQQPLGPPPPWHQGLALDEHCPDCAAPCMAACEPDIIRLHPADHELAGIPWLDFGNSGCTFCKACVTACPMEIEVTAAVNPVLGKAHLNRDTCIAWDDVICMSCHGRCDYQAISTEYQRRARIDSDRCTGCGMCVAVCPVNALHISA